MKKILVFYFGVISLIGGIVFAQDKPTMVLFYGETCPHCKTQEGYINQLTSKYNFNLVEHEIYFDRDNQKLMQEYANRFGTTFNSVPLVIVGDDYFMGADFQETERLLKKYSQLSEPEIIEEKIDIKKPGSNIKQELEIKIKQEDVQTISSGKKTQEIVTTGENAALKIEENIEKDQTAKIFGKEFSLKATGPIFFGAVLGLADGINPCMFGVLIFLLTYLISIGSKKKVLYSGLIFVATTFVLYFGIMYLMHRLIFSTMAFLPYIAYIKYGIGVLAIFMGLIEIKDFFRYGKGISLAIPKFIKPSLEYITMKGTYMSVFILAILSSFVELPCTIGIPLAYVGAVGNKINIFTALSIYNIFFIIPLVVIILGIYFGFSAFKSGNKELAVNKLSNKKFMRLFAGIILVGIGILFLMKIL